VAVQRLDRMPWDKKAAVCFFLSWLTPRDNGAQWVSPAWHSLHNARPISGQWTKAPRATFRPSRMSCRRLSFRGLSHNFIRVLAGCALIPTGWPVMEDLDKLDLYRAHFLRKRISNGP